MAPTLTANTISDITIVHTGYNAVVVVDAQNNRLSRITVMPAVGQETPSCTASLITCARLARRNVFRDIQAQDAGRALIRVIGSGAVSNSFENIAAQSVAGTYPDSPGILCEAERNRFTDIRYKFLGATQEALRIRAERIDLNRLDVEMLETGYHTALTAGTESSGLSVTDCSFECPLSRAVLSTAERTRITRCRVNAGQGSAAGSIGLQLSGAYSCASNNMIEGDGANRIRFQSEKSILMTDNQYPGDDASVTSYP